MRNLRASISSGSFGLWTVVLGLSFLASRVLFLDRDVPRYDFTEIQPLDEFFYTIPAFNLYHYGGMSHRVVSYIPSDGAPVNLLESVLTALTLAIVGNNYFGLRLASVLAAAGVLVLLLAIILRETRSRIGVLVAMVYLVCDFSFNMAARVAEPTIFRVLAMVAVLYVASAWPEDRPNWVARATVMGFLAVSALVFVYPYNAFIVPAVYLMLLVESLPLGTRRVLVSVGAGVAGGALAMVAFAAATYAGYGESPLDVYFKNIAPFGGRLSLHDLPVAVSVNLNEILFTNFFRFNPVVLVLVSFFLPSFVHRVVTTRRSFDILVAAMTAVLIVQTSVASDYPERRLIIFQPLAILVVALGAANFGVFRGWLASSVAARVITYVYAGVFAWLVLRVYVGPVPLLGARYEFLVVACTALLVAGAALVAWRGARWRPAALAAIAVALALPGITLTAQQLLVDPTYRYRDAMIASRSLLDGRVTAGVYAYAFRLYNTSQPVLNPYEYQYSESKLAEYNRDLQRLLAEGTFGASVSDPDNQTLQQLGLSPVATYFINIEGHKRVVIYAPAALHS